MEIDTNYVLEKFYTYCKRPIKKGGGVYNAECPICNEGKSRGRKRRLYYFQDKNSFYCHNCSLSWNATEWLQEVTGKSIMELIAESHNFTPKQEFMEPVDLLSVLGIQKQPEKKHEEFVSSWINLSDSEEELDRYSQDSDIYKILKIAYQYCKHRRLFTAVNTCTDFYVLPHKLAQTDHEKAHADRLIIPFKEYETYKVVCFQSRTLNKNEHPKYLTSNGTKILFGECYIDPSLEHIFLTEGPIDAMFIRNGMAMAGGSLTSVQQEKLDTTFKDYKKVYVYDNDPDNKQIVKKLYSAIAQGDMVFVWPPELKQYKDFNDICVAADVDEITHSFLLKHVCQGAQAKIKATLWERGA